MSPAEGGARERTWRFANGVYVFKLVFVRLYVCALLVLVAPNCGLSDHNDADDDESKRR